MFADLEGLRDRVELQHILVKGGAFLQVKNRKGHVIELGPFFLCHVRGYAPYKERGDQRVSDDRVFHPPSIITLLLSQCFLAQTTPCSATRRSRSTTRFSTDSIISVRCVTASAACVSVIFCSSPF